MPHPTPSVPAQTRSPHFDGGPEIGVHYTGTGFIANIEKRLVVTNFHVVGRETKVVAIFPLYDRSGELVTDARRYKERPKEIAVNGTVIAKDSSRDLALIRVDRFGERSTTAPLARRPAATGSVLYSVGGSGAEENLVWRLTKGTVRGRVQRSLQANFGRVDCMILETDSPVNPGDSGGPAMNDRGELVGVVSHFLMDQRQVSGNIDVEEVRAFLARHVPAP